MNGRIIVDLLVLGRRSKRGMAQLVWLDERPYPCLRPHDFWHQNKSLNECCPFFQRQVKIIDVLRSNQIMCLRLAMMDCFCSAARIDSIADESIVLPWK